uniref:NAD(P)H-hydrate dehydratase n=1 Tax=Agathobacter sp. TaxID=2021311 RepID=UPI0040579530
MKHIITGKEMKMLDINTSQHFHVPEAVLMEQAALAFVHEFHKVHPHSKKGIVFCGLGNNGGDGIAIARLLNEQGIAAEVCYVNEFDGIEGKCSDLFCLQQKIYEAYQFPTVTPSTLSENEWDFVIDAIFGTGLSRDLNEAYCCAIDLINQLSGKKFAVDIPSGIHSDTGKRLGAAVKCDYTITFSFEKLGQFLWPGNEYTGTLIRTPIGITERSWLEQKPKIAALEWQDLSQLPKRMAHSNKGTYGKLLIIAGTKDMAGAAILAAKAAYRTGAGLVKVYTGEENRTIIQTAVPEAILSAYASEISEAEIQKHLEWADAVVLGPGIGTSARSETLVSYVIKNVRTPILLDADALNILSKDITHLHFPDSNTVITPHLGEMARLTGKSVAQIQSELPETAESFANRHRITCVLKDFRTITAGTNGLSYLNLSGNHGMATAGSGDVLTGIIGTLLAQGMETDLAAAFGVFLHGLAGDMAIKKTGAHGMCAQDIIEGLKEIWNKVEHDGNQ